MRSSLSAEAKPRIVITGGAGYIGSHAWHQLQADYDVVVLDSLQRGHSVLRSDQLRTVNLSDQAGIAAVLREREVAAVIHFAAFAYVGESMLHPELYFQNNVTYTMHLLDAMQGHNVRNLVLSSTCAVYGAPPPGLISEATPLAPINPYGESKVMVERLLHWYGVCHGLRWVALRYFNAGGADPTGAIPGEDHDPEPHIIPRLLAVANGRFPCFEVLGDTHATPDGTCIRDYIHVTDLAEAHGSALSYLLSGGPSCVLNLGRGEGASVRELIATAEQVTGRHIPVRILPARVGDPPILVANPTRAREVLEWRARFGLRDIIESTWQWEQRRRYPSQLSQYRW